VILNISEFSHVFLENEITEEVLEICRDKLPEVNVRE